jgi:hypothetical protein
MLEQPISNGVRTILIDTASRFARDLIVEETGHELTQSPLIALTALSPTRPLHG